MKKKILSVILAVMMMAFIFTGCGTTSKSPEVSPTGTTENTDNTSADIDVTQPSVSTEIETIKVYMPLVGGGTTTDVDKVAEAINEYIEPLIYANIELTYIPYSSWEQQMNLTVASGGQVDLMCSVREISNYYKNGALIPLSDLIDTYGIGIKEYVKDTYLDACAFDGEIYGVPTLRDMAKQQSFEYSADIAEKYGLEMKENMTLDEVEAQLYKLKAAAPDIVGVLMRNSVRTFNGWNLWDDLGDSFGVVFNSQKDLTLYNLYESEEYTDLLYRMEKWYNDGIINRDAPTSNIQWGDLIATGNLFGRIAKSKPGMELQETNLYGVELKMANLMDPITDSAQVQFIAWTIPTTAEYPEKAMLFMNLLYTDPTVVNLMSYGIEGEHYVVTDESVGFINYPEGVDFTTTGYGASMNYAVGNEFLGYKWEGNAADIWDEMKEFNDTAIASPSLGFAFDNSAVANEITACNNVLQKYALALEIGCLDVDIVLPEFQKALKDAGIDIIIAEKQAQINEWAANNK